ncbi:MAG: diguanylate cyclase, partial [Planctomycetota bacterium]
FIDLDNFKAINDSYGHTAGDEVLRGVARILRTTLRKCDLVARWGGEEFVALLPGATAEGAGRAIERALERLRETPFELDGEPVHVTFSAGVIEIESELPVEQALAAADRRLYAAKEAGRNRVVVSEPAGDRPRHRLVVAEDDDMLAAALVRALEREGFEVLHCPDGAAALAAIEREGASLLLLDVRLPDSDGFEILTKLRRSRFGARLPVVILTAMGSERDVVRGFELGADDYVLKPFSLTELIARVRRLLQRRRVPRRAR